jgi:hypothetical protein
MIGAYPLIPANALSRRAILLIVATLVLHVIVVWLMLDIRAKVDRQTGEKRELWVSIRPATGPVITSQRAQAPQAPTRPRIVVPTIALPPAQQAQQPQESPPLEGQDGNLRAPATPSASPLDLRLRPDLGEQTKPLTPAKEAMQDPRSNTLRLTRDERLRLVLGEAECIAWQRMPNGSVYRGAGHLRPSFDVPPRPDGTRVMECVR